MPSKELGAGGDTIDKALGLSERPAGDGRWLPGDCLEQFGIAQGMGLLMQCPRRATCKPVPYIVDFPARALVVNDPAVGVEPSRGNVVTTEVL